MIINAELFGEIVVWSIVKIILSHHLSILN